MLAAVFLALAAVTFHADFEGGSLGKVEQVSGNHYRCAVAGESDQNKRNRQASWYYFRIDGARGQALTIDLVDLVGEYNYRPGAHAVTKNTRPVYSEDGRLWTHFRDDQVSWDETAVVLRLHLTPRSDRVWIAHVPPYTNRNLAELLAEFERSPDLKRESTGRTVGGQEIPLLTITNRSIAESRKKTVWLMCRQHAWESGTSWACEGALRFLMSPAAARLREQVTFKMSPMADPDGVARGGVRFNAKGYDLNRNWDAVDAKLMPEIAGERQAIFHWLDSGHHIDLFLTLHNTEDGEYLEGPVDQGTGAMRALGERFFLLLTSTTTFAPTTKLRDSGVTTTPGQAGRMTVNQALFHDRAIPAFLLEQMIEYNPKLDRLPTVQDRLEFGAQLVQAMAKAVTEN